MVWLCDELLVGQLCVLQLDGREVLGDEVLNAGALRDRLGMLQELHVGAHAGFVTRNESCEVEALAVDGPVPEFVSVLFMLSHPEARTTAKASCATERANRTFARYFFLSCTCSTWSTWNSFGMLLEMLLEQLYNPLDLSAGLHASQGPLSSAT